MRLRRAISRTYLFGLCLFSPLVGMGCTYLTWKGNAQEVRFANEDGLTLSGLLLKPSKQGLSPAVIFLHGSGPETRGGVPYKAHANHFVRNGFAALVYDKRGTGESEGDFDSVIYEAFIQDAVAAVKYLRSRPDIDPNRIGLLGFSEGGWLTPEVAERVGQIAFIINKSGPPLSWMDTMDWETENEVRAEGFDGEHLDEALELQRAVWQYWVDTDREGPTATADSRQEIEDRIAALQSIPVFAELRVRVREYDPELYALLAEEVGYDPRPFLERMEIPILYVFGGKDVNLPTEQSVAYLEGLVSSGSSNISLHVYKDLGHSLQKWHRISTAGYPNGYFSLLSDWAKEHLRSNEADGG